MFVFDEKIFYNTRIWIRPVCMRMDVHKMALDIVRAPTKDYIFSRFHELFQTFKQNCKLAPIRGSRPLLWILDPPLIVKYTWVPRE